MKVSTKEIKEWCEENCYTFEVIIDDDSLFDFAVNSILEERCEENEEDIT